MLLKSYVTIALRRLQREKTYVAINIFSLALGIHAESCHLGLLQHPFAFSPIGRLRCQPRRCPQLDR